MARRVALPLVLLAGVLGGLLAVSRPDRTPPPESVDDYAARLLALHDARRSVPLSTDPALSAAARSWAAECARRNRLSHDDFIGRIRAAGYTGWPVSENAAAGQRTADEAFGDWMGSPGRCRSPT